VAATLAAQDGRLGAAVRELAGVLRASPPALRALDASLPALVDATDPLRAGRLLDGQGPCRVTLVRYGRGRRCVLRYELEPPGAAPRQLLAKVSGDGSGAHAYAALRALPAGLARLPARRRFALPHSPGFDAECVRWIAEESPLVGVGVETVGIDAGAAGGFDPPFPAHFYLMGANKYGVTQLANLGALPPTGTLLLVAPLKLTGGTGSPVRAFALVPHT
jgi:hypothetical protein